jgi:integrase
LLTGARRSEIAKLSRDRILSDRLVLPPTHTKMCEKHEVPLTDLMRAIIAAQPATVSTLVFASEKTGRAFNGWGKSAKVTTPEPKKPTQGDSVLRIHHKF